MMSILIWRIYTLIIIITKTNIRTSTRWQPKKHIRTLPDSKFPKNRGHVGVDSKSLLEFYWTKTVFWVRVSTFPYIMFIWDMMFQDFNLWFLWYSIKIEWNKRLKIMRILINSTYKIVKIINFSMRIQKTFRLVAVPVPLPGGRNKHIPQQTPHHKCYIRS